MKILHKIIYIEYSSGESLLHCLNFVSITKSRILSSQDYIIAEINFMMKIIKRRIEEFVSQNSFT